MSLIENKSLTLAEHEQFTRAVSVVSSQLNTKARIGAVSQSFNPNAVDGDGDGLVQDGSPFERPAVIGAITSAAQRVGRILSKAGRSRQSRAKEYHRRYSGMSAQEIAKDVVPANFNEWAALTYEKLRVANPQLPELNPETTPRDLREIVRRLEEFVEPDLLWMLSPEAAEKYKADKLIDKNKAFSELVEKSFDFSPQTVAKNRRLIEHVLTTNPQFRELVNRHGMPAVFGFGEGMDESHMANGFMSKELGIGLRQFRNPKAKGRLDFASRRIGKWFMEAMVSPEVRSKKSKRWVTRDGSPETLLVHEYGHYLSTVLEAELSDLDQTERTKKWQAWRFSVGSDWKATFTDIGRPDWYEKYKKDRENADVPQEVPHVETAYAETVPTEAWAEAIAGIFALDGADSDLVSDGMKELIADFLSLDPKRDIKEQLTPPRLARRIIPDGFASRGAVAEINEERDARFGELTDPYELTEEFLGKLDGDDPVGAMVRLLQEVQDDPEQWSKLPEREKEAVNIALNIRRANDEESQLVASVLENDPAFAEMIRRHGISNIYFSQTDLKLAGDHDVRGVLSGGFVPDGEQLTPPRIVIDLIGAEHERNLPDGPMPQSGLDEMKKYSKGKAPGNVTRKQISRSDKHVIRHEGGHAIHDILWEKQHRGEITGRRGTLIRAYGKRSWEEFYNELGRPDLWREHQRVLRATYGEERQFRGWLNSTTPSPEIAQVDSAYAWATPREMFAESFAAYTSSNPAYRELLNDTMIDHLQSILGDADNPDPSDIGEGFASVGDGPPPKSYIELRRDYVGAIVGNAPFTRSEMFQNTTTEQKVYLAVPADEKEWATMAFDELAEKMGLTWDQMDLIDLSDPRNPIIRDPGYDKGITFPVEALDLLDYYGSLLQMNMPDFSPEVVETNRDALRSALDAFPRLREISERHGLPPVATISASTQEILDISNTFEAYLKKFKKNQKINPKFEDAMPLYMDYKDNNLKWDDFISNPIVQQALDGWESESDVIGGYVSSVHTILLSKEMVDAFRDGTRIDHKFQPVAGGWTVGGNDFESTLLHEYSHYLDKINGRKKKEINEEINRLFEDVENHIKTEYGRTEKDEFVAEIVAAVLSGSRDQEEMLSPEARQLARRIAGLPEKDPVFAGRIPGKKPSEAEVLADRFGELWRRTTDGLIEPFDKEKGLRSRDGVPDVLETMMDAKLRTGLQEFKPVEFEHNGRMFTIREAGDTFEIDINSRTVARASVTPGNDGLPEINNVDVLPGYDGIAPDKDLHEMIVDHARKKYPSARAPRRARKAEVVSEGFASVGPEHHDARQIDGTPGTPEYAQAVAAEFAAAQAEGKKVFFDYNGETREVMVTEIYEKNGQIYMKGNDALRDGAERMFRLDRVSMPKRVENPETGSTEVVTKPGKPPRRPVPIFTGKAAELFEGAASWEEAAERLSKGRFVFFDFETTGIEENEFSTEYHHPGTPVQIGLVEIIDGKVTRRWSTHVNPGRPMSIDPKTGRSWSADNLKYKDPITGEVMPLTDEWLAQQKPLKDALEEMLEFIGPINETILGGQNHPYDDDVMKRALTDAGIDQSRWNPAGFIDSQALAQSLLDKNSDDYPRDPKKGYKTVSLGPLATWLGHDMGGGWHSADADSEASYEAFKRLVDRAALQEGQGITVRRDLFTSGGGEKEFKERLKGFENEKRGWDWKVKKYREQQSKQPEPAEGFASFSEQADAGIQSSIRRAANPARWETLTPEERDAATLASANAAIEYLNYLQDLGIDASALRDLDRAELDAILKDIIPGGEARVSDYVTGDGKALVEVSNATMGQVFMSLGFHVEVISDDPNEQHLLENGINDMQKALQDYVQAVAKNPDLLKRDAVFRTWAEKEGIDIAGLDDKKLAKAAKKFAEQFEINLCLYYKSGSNMLCGENIGIEREEMPQLGGRMKGDDTLAARAIKSGLMVAKEFKLDKDKFAKLDPEKQKQLQALAKDPAKVAELAKSKDPLVKELFDVLDWNDTEANVESIADQAAASLGIVVDKPRFVDPATMLGAQNQLQGSKVENMADGAVKAVLEALPILEARFGRKPTQEELMDYLANEIKHGLFQPTLTAGHPGSQIYMLDGHHRWSGLLMANKKLEAMGLDVRVQLNIKNYQTDIRSGLELGRAIQVAMGVKDAKLAGEDPFKFNPDAPELTVDEFDKIIKEMLDPANLIKKLQEVREGGKFRETEVFDTTGGQAERLNPRQVPISEIIAKANMPDPKPKSRVSGVKAQEKGYRAVGTGNGWTSVEDHIQIETERGNKLFETYQEYLDKGYEVAWVTHTPKEAGRYAISANQVNAFNEGKVSVDPANIDSVDLFGAELVGSDGEGGYLYARRKPSAAQRNLRRVVEQEEIALDQIINSLLEQNEEAFASTSRDKINKRGLVDRFVLLRDPAGNEARDIKLDAGSISKPTAMDPDEFYQIVGDVPGISESDELLATEKLTSSRVRNLKMYRATYAGKKGKKNRVFGTYKTRDGKKYSIAQDQDGFEGVYYAYRGDKRLDESKRVAKLTLLLNDGKKDVHDLFSIRVNKEDRKAGLAQALVEVAKADFPDASFTVQRVVTQDGANFAQNLEEEGFASTGTISIPLDLVSGVGDMNSSKRGGAAQRDREVVPDDWNTRQQKRIAGVRVPDHLRDEYGAPIPGAPIYRETTRIGRKKYTFEADVNGLVSVYTGRDYKQVAQLNLDRGHSMAGGTRAENPDRHYIDFVSVDKKHRRKGIATQMAVIAEHAYGGSVEHSTALSDAGRAWRDADVKNRGAAALPLRDGAPTIDSVFNEGFASRGTANSDARRSSADGFASTMGRTDKTPDQIIGEQYLEARLNGYQQFGGNVSNTELNMLAIYQSWKESDEPWESFVARFPALQSMIKKEMSRYEQQAITEILEDMSKKRRTPRPSMTTAQREGAIRRVNNPQLRAANSMAESVIDVGRLEQQRQDLELQKNYMTWKNSGQTWEQFTANNPAIEKLIENQKNNGALIKRISEIVSDRNKPKNNNGRLLESPEPLSSLDKLADLMNLDETETIPNRVMSAVTGRINERIANGEATLAEKLGITPEQLRERLANVAVEIDQFVDRFVNDKEVRQNVKNGLKILSSVAILLGSKDIKNILSTINPNLSGGGDGSGQSNNLLDLVDSVLSAGIHEALIAYGANFANLIATEFSAMRLVTRQKAKKMIEEIKQRIEGTGQYIGNMSKEMWARLRGAWAKVRPTAPIGMPATTKQWIVAGSSPMWAEMSWMDYQSKSRLTDRLLPTDLQKWENIAIKAGRSPELIDIASYRAGIGYGNKRIKPRDVIRVYTT